MSTLNRADVYGAASVSGSVGQAGGVGSVNVSGPNQSAVTTGMQGGSIPSVAGNEPAFSWVGFILVLVLLRIALEAGGESR